MANSFVALVALALASASPLTAQGWASIAPGKTTREAIEAALGSPHETRLQPDGSSLNTYRAVLDAAELTVGYLSDGRVGVLGIVPSGDLREADIVSVYGSVKSVKGQRGDGNRVVHYPMGGAQVDYRSDGTVSKILVTGGVLQNGLNVEGLLRGFISGRRP